jgi:cysteinyl-tRNA synthetase
LKIYDTLSRTKVEVQRHGEFRMFICGPTVQDNVHLGHAKTYIAFDVLARWLLKNGHEIFFLLNITDVDDKIFSRAKKENIAYDQIADKFFNAFVEDMDALNIVTISKCERVSYYVEESAALVTQLLKSGKAYRLNQNIYFDTSKAFNFGKLSHQSATDLKLKEIDAAPGKRNGVDFLLWRSVVGEDEGVWQTELGKGRPGWHIEDTAIAFSQLGGPYDLHGGATELIFPHHESELAQDEALSGEVPFVKIWMHTGLLLKDDEKMSKSLGNVITIREALKNYTSDEIRFHFLKRHYRESYEFDPRSLEKSREKFELVKLAAQKAPKPGEKSDLEDVAKSWREFSEFMDDDMRTPEALEVLSKVSAQLNEGKKEYAWVFWNMIEALGFRMF